MAAEPVALLRRPVTQVPGASVPLLPELIGLVYEGLNETVPWFGLAERLRHVLAARNVTVTLHHSDDRPSDVQVMSVEPHDETDWLLAEQVHRERFTQCTVSSLPALASRQTTQTSLSQFDNLSGRERLLNFYKRLK